MRDKSEGMGSRHVRSDDTPEIGVLREGKVLMRSDR